MKSKFGMAAQKNIVWLEIAALVSNLSLAVWMEPCMNGGPRLINPRASRLTALTIFNLQQARDLHNSMAHNGI